MAYVDYTTGPPSFRCVAAMTDDEIDKANSTPSYGYPDPEECSIAARPLVTGPAGEPTVTAEPIAPPPVVAAPVASPAGTASTTTTVANKGPHALAHYIGLREAERARLAAKPDPKHTSRWVCYVRGCAVTGATENKRGLSVHWKNGAHAEEKPRDPRKDFEVPIDDWFRDEGLRATWEAGCREEFDTLLA